MIILLTIIQKPKNCSILYNIINHYEKTLHIIGKYNISNFFMFILFENALYVADIHRSANNHTFKQSLVVFLCSTFRNYV